jgi:hypothetical protein
MRDALVLALTLLALLSLPCLVALAVCADDLLDRLTRALDRWRERRTLRRLDRTLGRDMPELPVDAEPRPTIEQIAADLRRLDRQRHGVARKSMVWHAAVLRAYDDRLRLASRCLGVAEHLDQLEGMDLEIERVRVEGQLQAAGLALRSQAPRRTDQH